MHRYVWRQSNCSIGKMEHPYIYKLWAQSVGIEVLLIFLCINLPLEIKLTVQKCSSSVTLLAKWRTKLDFIVLSLPFTGYLPVYLVSMVSIQTETKSTDLVWIFVCMELISGSVPEACVSLHQSFQGGICVLCFSKTCTALPLDEVGGGGGGGGGGEGEFGGGGVQQGLEWKRYRENKWLNLYRQ